MARTSSVLAIQLRYWRPVPSRAPRPSRNSGQQRAQDPAAAGQHQAAAQVHHPGARRGGGRGGLPVADQRGQEPAPGRGRLGHRPVAGVAVPADGRGAQQHRRGIGRGRDGLDDGPGAGDPAVAQLLLAGRGPAAAGDGRTGQVHHAVGAAEHGRVEPAGRGPRIPADLGRRCGGPADQPGDLDAVPVQAGGQGRADQPGRAADDDAHRPVPPRTSPRRRAGPQSPSSVSKAPSSSRALTRDQEPGGVGAVHQPVVVGQRQVDHRPDGDDLAERRVLDHDGALDDGAGAEDADLRLVDDRRVEQRAAAAGVGQRERAAGQVVRADLAGPGALRPGRRSCGRARRCSGRRRS